MVGVGVGVLAPVDVGVGVLVGLVVAVTVVVNVAVDVKVIVGVDVSVEVIITVAVRVAVSAAWKFSCALAGFDHLEKSMRVKTNNRTPTRVTKIRARFFKYCSFFITRYLNPFRPLFFQPPYISLSHCHTLAIQIFKKG